MTKPTKQTFYEEQIPELLVQMKRIADALERQVELTEERQALARQSLEKETANLDGQREQRRKKFEAQLQKLAEVDRMARELRSKLEEKQAAEMAAKAEAAAAAEGELPPAKEVEAGGKKRKVAKKPAPPTEN